MMYFRPLLGLLLLTAVTSCTTTRTRPFVEPMHRDKTYSNVGVSVAGVFPELAAAIAERICDKLRSEGAACMTDKSLLPPEGHYNAADVTQVLNGHGIDGWLLLEAAGGGTSSRSIGRQRFAEAITIGTIPYGSDQYLEFYSGDGEGDFLITLWDVASQTKTVVIDATQHTECLPIINDDILSSSVADKVTKELSALGLLPRRAETEGEAMRR